MRKRCNRKRRGTGLPVIFGFDEELSNHLFIAPYESLDAMTKGEGSEAGARSLDAIARICERLCEPYTDGVQAIARRAVEASASILKRGIESARWGISGDEYVAIRDCLTLLANIKDSGVRRKEFAKAINHVMGWA